MKIYILESLRKNDPKTGKHIYDLLRTQNIDCEFHNFTSKSELKKILKLIEIDSGANEFQPFVHIDCHGNDEGIGAVKKDETEELITWKDLSSGFRSIYTTSKRKSIICMSSCKGFNAIKMVAYNQPCPYDHICGSFEKISFSDSFLGYATFYQAIISGKNVFDASVEVHNHPDLKEMKFLGLSAKSLFKLAIDGYIKNECTVEKLRENKQKMINKLNSVIPLTTVQMFYLDKLYTLQGQKEILENHSATFFLD